MTLGRPLAAIQTLRAAMDRDPHACETRTWLAWLRLQQGEPGLALRELEADGCPAAPEDAGRTLWLKAYMAGAAGDGSAARRSLSALGDRGALYDVDRPAWRDLNRRLRPGWEPPVAVSAELALGGASHALAAIPTDRPGAEVASAFARPALRLAWRAPEARRLTPFADLVVNANGLSAPEARRYSLLEGSLRMGAQLGSLAGRSPRFAYAHDELLLDDRARTRYSAADRAELALTPSTRLALQLSLAQRRFFFEQNRDRSELDGVGMLSASAGRVAFQLGASWRWYAARDDAYDQLGGTVMASAEVPLTRRIRGRASALVGRDVFPHSGGARGVTAFGTEAERCDTVVRASIGVWRALGASARFGLEYERAQRFSTAAAPGFFYPYTAHRVLLRVRMDKGGNPWRARSSTTEPHVPLWAESQRGLTPAGLDPGVLRQDVELQGDCGCAVR